ncbi:Bifunctional hemolysin/adenylate cyclase precursor [Rubripirellula obstinata]|uniref:Bifunctional hemolysin/adenylate cyclase n=2 Tax=Rubripirellula obstinata TaxID=406547 RepID=A0A5B1CFJ5_9BACT|nr:Bifunctional hemolysin/adenylate cyclase precursor [Rubripirellula obstinata]
MLMEQLESRQLLSANPLTPRQQTQLDTQLSSLTSFADHVDDRAELNRPLAFLGTSFNEHLDISDVVQSSLVEPLTTFIVPGQSQSSDDVAGLLQGSQAGDLVVSFAPVEIVDDGELTFATTLYATRSVQYDVDLGVNGDNLGLSLSDVETRTAEFSLKFELQFGVEAGTDGEFFTRIESLQTSVTDTTQLVAGSPMPELETLTEDVTFSLLINDDTTITATVPANTAGNLTPLPERITAALATPLADAGFSDAIVGSDDSGRLALRAISADVRSFALVDAGGLAALGFADGQSSSSNFNPTFDYGLIALDSDDAGIAITGVMDVFADDGGDSRLSADELNAAPVLTTQARRGGSLESRLQPSSGTIVAGNPTARASIARLFSAGPLAVTPDGFDELDRLHDRVSQTLRDGFAAITQFGERLETETGLGNVLPALDISFAGATDLDALLRSKLQTTVEDLLAVNDRPSWEDVRAALQNQGLTVSEVDETGDAASFDIGLQQTDTTQTRLTNGDAAEDDGFAATEDQRPELTLQTTSNWAFEVTVDRSGEQSPLEAFVVVFDRADHGAEVTTGTISFDANVGLLGVTATGTPAMDATLSATIDNGQSVTAAQLINQPIATLVATSETGQLDLDLTLAATLSGVPFTATMGLSPGAVFGGQSELQAVDFGQVEDFVNFTANELSGGVSQIGRWLGDFAEAKLTRDMPLAAARQVSELLDLRGVFESQIASLLSNDEGQLNFGTIQELDALTDFISNPNYDQASNELTFTVSFDGVPEFADLEILSPEFDFDFEIGDFKALTADGSFTLSPSVFGEFVLGIDLTPIGAGSEAIDIDGSTLLSELNDGMGVQDINDNNPDIVITQRDGTSHVITFDGVTTVDDVIAAINVATPVALTAALYDQNGDQNGIVTGIRLTDNSVGDTVFAVDGVDGSLAGFGLGILGETDDTNVDDGRATINGGALHGDTPAHHLFVEEIAGRPIAGGKIELTSGEFSATANLGITEVEITGASILGAAAAAGLGDVPSFVQADVGLPKPRMTVAELFDSLRDNVDEATKVVADFTGSIQVEFPTSFLNVGNSQSVDDAAFVATINEFGDDLVADVSGDIDSVLAQLGEIDAGEILDGLKDGLTDLLNFDGLKLPILNIELPDAAGLQTLLADVTAAIDTIGSATLDVLSDGIQRLANLDPARPEIDFPEIEISLPDLFGFFDHAQEMAPEEGSGDTFSLPDFESLIRDLFDFEVDLPDVEIPPEEFGVFLDGVVTILDQLQLSGPGSLQGLEAKLEEAIGLGEEGVTLQIVTDNPNASSTSAVEVRFDLNLSDMIEANYPINIDLADLGVDIPGVGDLIDVGGSASVRLSAGVAANLALGLEIASGESVTVTPFLYTGADGTALTLTAGAVADDIDFEASVGPLGIAIVDGVAGVTGNDTAQDASFIVSLDDGTPGDGRYLFDNTIDFGITADGQLSASLPIEFPTGSALETLDLSVDFDAQTAQQLRDGFAITSNFADVQTALQNQIDSFGDDISGNLLALVGGWEGAFDLLTDAMRGDVLGVPLPIIGEALADEADFLQEIKQSVLDNLQSFETLGVSIVQTEIFNALGPGGLDLLDVLTGDGTLAQHYVLADTSDSGSVDFDIRIAKAAEPIEVNPDFDLGLPGLNFDLDADVVLDFGFAFDLGFGVSLDEGFYFDTDDTNLVVSFDAAVPNLDASGQLAFLGVQATSGIGDDGLPQTRFSGAFDVTLNDPTAAPNSADAKRLTLSEMFASDLSDVVQHQLNANAQANLHLVASIGNPDVLPSIRTDLIVDWGFGDGIDSGTPLSVEFTEVEMNIGEFFAGFAGDVLGRVQDVLEPVQPVIDVLTTRLPVISDFGGSDVTLVDLARMFGRADVADFLQSIVDVNDLINSLPDPSSFDETNTWVSLGGFAVDASALGGFDPAADPDAPVMIKELKLPEIPNPQDILGQVGTGSTPGGGFKNNLAGAKGELSFPLLESPTTAFNLLIGRDVDLFLYDAPALGIDFSYNQSFPTPIPGLFAEIGGRIAAVADFAFGFDTSGISQFSETGFLPDIFDGFFVSDRANPDGTGADVAEAYLRGSLTAGGKIDVLIAAAGVRGGIFAEVDFNLNDPDRDGRVRAGEIAENFALGPIHVFDVDGRVDAGVNGFYRVLFFEDEFEIARVNLLNFDIARPTGAELPALATQSAGGELTIPFTSGDDDYSIIPGQTAGSIIVQGQGRQSGEFLNVTSIVGNSGSGDDIVTISPKIFVPVTISGGAGNDQLSAGGGPTAFNGGTGDDRLTGGLGEDNLDGGDGNDVIIGGAGVDQLSGGAGDDYIDGGRGADLISGGDGNDQLFGGFDADVIDGDAGDDVIEGGRGGDVIRGGAGDDRVSGGRGDDSIEGGLGSDELDGDEGSDFIDGGDGSDRVRGGERNDVLRGGEGDDEIDGGSGDDEIRGGSGDDLLRGGVGRDDLFGDDGDDLIYAVDDASGNETIGGFIDAGAGNDVVYGSFGDDVIVGGLGDDELHGLDGSDLIWGGLAAYASSNFDISNPNLFELPPRFVEASNLDNSDYSPTILVTPRVVSGFSVPGNVPDGDDLIDGGAGTDFLFGGSDADTIFGGEDADYIDGGSGDDGNLFGDAGDDVIRGGSGADVIRGGTGIDQIYGDAGRDLLRGDSGGAGQRLFGGDDVDTLYAWNDATSGSTGEALFGGAGGDFLYGAGANAFLFGESGPDYLVGGLGDDVLDGGGGQDQLYGGEGDDELRGGADGDWLEGQLGSDTLVGGGGIDFLILDVGAQHASGDQESFDGHGDGTPDDNATDVLLVNGTKGNDTITLSATPLPLAGEVGLSGPGEGLRVIFDTPNHTQTINATWQSTDGPLIEQFRVSTGNGNDTITFDPSLDLSELSERSRDFVTVVEAGPGNDTIIGSGARDRIDGGRGSDTIFGNGGDDRLWGDQGPGDGSSNDVDTIYAGQGNDDVLGGQGTNRLYAWSSDPTASAPFGIFNNNGQLEDTGLNRIIGGPGEDHLYGGTGLDLLYGGEGDNTLYSRTGSKMEDLDAGAGDVDWKDYARQNDQVWYVGGSNRDDQINLEYVTEIGFAQDHHLITRLTRNVSDNGTPDEFFTLSASVRLDFAATDNNGVLIWDPDDVFADNRLIQDDDPIARAEALNTTFSDAEALSRLLPPEDDFRAIIIDALDGDDVINVGPTVQKTVWVDAGAGDDTVLISSGNAILIDQTDLIGSRNNSIDHPFDLASPAAISGEEVDISDYVLQEDATFTLIVDQLEQHITVTVDSGTTIENESLLDLAADINLALRQAGAEGLAVASVSGDIIVLSGMTADPTSRLAINAHPEDPAVTQWKLPSNASASVSSILSSSVRYTGLTIDNPSDIDFYRFTTSTAIGDPNIESIILVDSLRRDDGMTLAVFVEGESEPVDPIDAAQGSYSLLADTTYVIRVASDATPTVYDLTIDLAAGSAALPVDYATKIEFERRDVIFGGDGNDVLQGGPGEDFIFGGAGNDVLTGGSDRGASDLLFGEDGDDTFQTIPDFLPTLTGTTTTYLPTQSDRFAGGEGDDRVVFLGGDLDNDQQPINDLAAVRFNRLLQRYEISTLVWDTAGQSFAASDDPDSTTSLLRGYHFFTALGVDQMQVDLGAGDDTWHADGESSYVFPGDQTGATWGINEGDVQSGARIFDQIEVLGGAGNDQLFGGSVSERFDGGTGSDFISGGLGDDQIAGGEGDDVLLGGSGIAPDDLEFVSRSFGASVNDTYVFSAELTPLLQIGIPQHLNFHQGDTVDWYAVSPGTLPQFDDRPIAPVTADMIRVVDVDNGEDVRFTLFDAEVTGIGDELLLVPVEDPIANPQNFLIRVDNQLESESKLQTASRQYRVELLEPFTLADGGAGDEVVDPGDDSSVDRQFAAARLATPVVPSPPSTDPPGLDLRSPTRLRDAVTIEGTAEGDRLSGARSIGDVNGDGIEDVVIEGVSASYVYFGPFDLDGIQSVEQFANLIIRGRTVAGGSGDLTGDGVDDLVLIRRGFDEANPNAPVMEIYSGGFGVDRELDVNSAIYQTALNGENDDAANIELIDWDGDGLSELLVSFDPEWLGFRGYIVGFDPDASESEELIASVKLLSLRTDELTAPVGTTVNPDAPVTTRLIGDVNGDGKDDIALVSPHLFTRNSDGMPIGQTFVVLGGTVDISNPSSPNINATIDSGVVISGTALGQDIFPLGDINRDGYDDFAISRTLEGTGELEGGLLIYHGTADFVADPAPPIELTDSYDDAAYRVSRQGVSDLAAGTALTGPIFAAAGDFFGARRADLVVGIPSQSTLNLTSGVVLQMDRRGQVGIIDDIHGVGRFYSITGAGPIPLDVQLTPLTGSTSSDLAGSIARGPLSDLNGDGLPDLFIGAAGFDGLRDGVQVDAGRVYFIPGQPPSFLPNLSTEITVLENDGGRMIDRGSDMPEVFGSSGSQDDPYFLRVGRSSWFQFTTAGDGGASSNQADHIRIEMLSGEADRNNSPILGDLITADGEVISQNQRITDLRNLKAGTYFFRVHRRNQFSPRTELEFQIQFDAPTLGNSHPSTDRDRIDGGPGKDQLIGGAGLDVLFGDDGRDRFQAETIEIFDLDRADGESFTIDPIRSNEIIVGSDQVVLDGPSIDHHLRVGIARALGHVITMRPDGVEVAREPILASEMAQLERLDLSGMQIADLSGLEFAINLRVLDLSDNEITDLPSVEDYPYLQTLTLSSNRITDLYEIAGASVVDNIDAGFSEVSGVWQSQVRISDDANLGGYRFTDTDGGVADFELNVPLGESVELLATWPILGENAATDAAFSVYDGDNLIATIPVLQTIAPDDSGGVPGWLSLGQFTFETDSARLQLSATNGIVVADAVMLIAGTPATANLTTLNLEDNPLDDLSRQALIPIVEFAGIAVTVSAPTADFVIEPIADQLVRHGSLALDDQVAVLPASVLDGAGSFLIEFWYQIDQASDQTVVSSVNQFGNDDLLIQFTDFGQSLLVDVESTDRQYSLPASVQPGTWHHYAIERNVGDFQINVYVDGTLIPTDRFSIFSIGNLDVGDRALVIGQEQTAVNGGYVSGTAAIGKIDELRFWDPFWETGGPTIQEHLAANRHRTVPRDSPGLRAAYRFDDQSTVFAVDASINGRDAVLGDPTGGAGDQRNAPTRSSSAPVHSVLNVDLTTGADYYTANSSNPDVITNVAGNQLQLEYRADQTDDSVITVAAFGIDGQQTRTGFNLHVDTSASGAFDPDQASELTFTRNGSLQSFFNTYGDRLQQTPNVELDFSSNASISGFSFSGLEDVLVVQRGVESQDIVEITFKADPGYEVALHGLELGNAANFSFTIPRLEVFNQDDTSLWLQSNRQISGTNVAHQDLNFPQTVFGDELTLVFEPGTVFVGLDNVRFSQRAKSLSSSYHHGQVFDDANDDGQQQPSEVGLPGTTVILRDQSNNVIASSITDSSGFYRLIGTPALDVRRVEVLAPDNWSLTTASSIALQLEPVLPVLQSTDFDFQYEFDVNPTSVDLDENGSNDWDANPSGSLTVSEGLLTTDPGETLTANLRETTSWQTYAPTLETGFTVELSAAVLSQGTGPSARRGAFQVVVSAGGTSTSAALLLSENSVGWRNDPAALGVFDDQDQQHVYRIVQTPGADEFYVWRDNVLLNPGGLPLSSGVQNITEAQIYLGDGSSTISGTTAVDYLRFTRGAFLPETAEINFGLSQPVRIGDDRIVSTGTPQVINVQSEIAGLNWTWTIDGIAAEPASDNTSLNFTPAVEGDIVIGVTATTPGGTLYSDQILVRASDTPAQPLISLSPNQGSAPLASFNTGIHEGESFTIFADLSAMGLENTAVDYQWTLIDSAGNTVDQQSGSSLVPDWELTIGDDGEYEVTLTVTNGTSQTTSSPLPIAVDNVAPVLSLPATPSVLGDSPLTFSGSFTDPGDDVWLATADFGDGNRRPVVLEEDKTFSIEHEFDQPGVYRVSVTVDDQDGGKTSRTFRVAYDPFAPTMVNAAGRINESADASQGAVFVSRLDVDDRTDDDRHVFELIAGEGSTNNDLFEIQNGSIFWIGDETVDSETTPSYQVRVRVTDSAGNVLEQALEIEVNDANYVKDVRIGTAGSQGSAQRSRIDQVEVVIDGEVQLSPGAFKVERIGASAGTVETVVSSRTVDGDTVVTITFVNESDPGESVSLVDGNYRLLIDATTLRRDGNRVQLDGDGDGNTGDDFVFGEIASDGFFSLYADTDGDGRVGLSDFATFRSAFGTSDRDAGFLDYLDANSDGTIGLADFAAFRSSFGNERPNDLGQ